MRCRKKQWAGGEKGPGGTKLQGRCSGLDPMIGSGEADGVCNIYRSIIDLPKPKSACAPCFSTCVCAGGVSLLRDVSYQQRVGWGTVVGESTAKTADTAPYILHMYIPCDMCR